jgi:UDP-N-acetylmuramate: L-alanyl-gamma-D-glutamyl-meso-diaminopimelate ligase
MLSGESVPVEKETGDAVVAGSVNLFGSFVMLAKQVGSETIIAIVEPRSNTMRMGVHTQSLAESLALSDKAIIYQPENLDWDLSELKQYAENIEICTTLDQIIEKLKVYLQTNKKSHFVLMSNGSFGGIYQRLIDELY